MTERRTPKQRAAHMAELLAEVAAQSLAEDAEQAGETGQGKPWFPVVDVPLRLTPEQASALLLYLERGGGSYSVRGSTMTPDLHEEMQAGIRNAAAQMRRAGITIEKDDEGQGKA